MNIPRCSLRLTMSHVTGIVHGRTAHVPQDTAGVFRHKPGLVGERARGTRGGGGVMSLGTKGFGGGGGMWNKGGRALNFCLP